MLVNRDLDWNPHKQRRSSLSIHFNVWMPVEVSFFAKPTTPQPTRDDMRKACQRCVQTAQPNVLTMKETSPVEKRGNDGDNTR
jgi:hypothetical protein